MKTFTILGFEINFNLSIERVKILTFDIPGFADDTCVSHHDYPWDEINNEQTETEVPWHIAYYKGGTKFKIELPRCKRAEKVFLTPMYSIINGKKTRIMENRIIKVNCYF